MQPRTTDYRVRSLTRTDAEPLLGFYRRLPDWIVHWYDPFPSPDEQKMQAHLERADSGEAISYGLCEASAIRGHGFILGVRGPAPVFGIGLEEAAIGRGQGRLLMEVVISQADAREIPLVTLTVFKENERARRLYEAFGFVVTGEAGCRSPGDSHAMERRRPPGNASR